MTKLINKIKGIKIESPYLLILFFGAVSTLAGGVWVIILDCTVGGGGLIGAASYASNALGEVTFSALLHIAVGIILYFAERKKVE